MAPPLEGAWYNSYNAETLSKCQSHSTFSGPGDSFYEYIMKFYLLTGGRDASQLDWLKQTTRMLKNSLVHRQENEKMPVMMIERDSSKQKILRMEHLACFAGGFWGLTSTLIGEEAEVDMQIARGVTRSCRESYVSSHTGIGPEAFDNHGKVYSARDKYFPNPAKYILRPETVESYFYMYRLTKDEKYREWAWDFVLALEAHCRAPFGYAGLKDVNTGQKNDSQESFFLAETLKYLYLVFSEDDLINLDEFVFNTEAHPLRINPRIWDMMSQ